MAGLTMAGQGQSRAMRVCLHRPPDTDVLNEFDESSPNSPALRSHYILINPARKTLRFIGRDRRAVPYVGLGHRDT
jgi:hypothetical protein